MTTLTNRPNTALLIIDAQTGVLANAHQRATIIANIATLIAKARQTATPIIWIQHNDDQIAKSTQAWQLVPELTPHTEDPLIAKNYPDSFEATALESTLAALSIGTLLIAGAQTDCCIRATLHGALTRGYDTILISDAHTTEDLTAYGAPAPGQVIAHTNLYWNFQTAPGRKAGTITTAEAFAPPAPGRT